MYIGKTPAFPLLRLSIIQAIIRTVDSMIPSPANPLVLTSKSPSCALDAIHTLPYTSRSLDHPGILNMVAAELSRFLELPLEVQMLVWTFAATPGDRPPSGESFRVSLRCMSSWMEPAYMEPVLWEYFCRVSGLFRMAPPCPTTTDAEHARIQLMASCRLGRQAVQEILEREDTAITHSTVRGTLQHDLPNMRVTRMTPVRTRSA